MPTHCPALLTLDLDLLLPKRPLTTQLHALTPRTIHTQRTDLNTQLLLRFLPPWTTVRGPTRLDSPWSLELALTLKRTQRANAIHGCTCLMLGLEIDALVESFPASYGFGRVGN